VRLLYDREQPTARLVAKNEEDLEPPLVCRSSRVSRFPFLIVWCIGYDPLFFAGDGSCPSKLSGTSAVNPLLFSSASLDLGNMGARASMSMVSIAGASGGCRSFAFRQSITAFGQLWGLVACHSYGHHGMRVCFPIRQLLCVISQSISKNIERLSYAQRLHTRKLARESPLVSQGESR